MKSLSRLLIAGLVGLSGCATRATSNALPLVVTTVYPVEEAARTIGGEHIDVFNLTPPGAEPHDVEVRSSDVRRLREASLIFYIGSGFQPSVEDAIESIRGARAIDLIEAVRDRAIQVEGDADRSFDPHFWLSPEAFREVASVIVRELIDSLPSNSSELRARGDRFERQLADLHRDYNTGLEACERRTIITTHAAFGHMAREYGLKQVSIMGLAPNSEPSPKKLQEITQLVRNLGATTIFYEPLVSGRAAKTIARNAGASAEILNPIESLSPDERSSGLDYFVAMGANLSVLRKALGCN